MSLSAKRGVVYAKAISVTVSAPPRTTYAAANLMMTGVLDNLTLLPGTDIRLVRVRCLRLVAQPCRDEESHERWSVR
jgi:hypothetical protein